MIKTLELFFVAMVFLSTNPSQATELGTKTIEQEIMASFNSLVDASKSLDIKKYFQHFNHKKFVGLNSDGTNWNSISELKQIIEPGFAAVEKVESLVFTNIRISVIDENTAILVNEYEQQLVLKGGQTIKLAGGGTQVWSKLDGVWKIVSVSSSHPPLTND